MWRWCDLHSSAVRMVVYVSVIIVKALRYWQPLQMHRWNIWCQIPHIWWRYVRHLHHWLRHERWDGRNVIVIVNRKLLTELSALSILGLIIAMSCLWT